MCNEMRRRLGIPSIQSECNRAALLVNATGPCSSPRNQVPEEQALDVQRDPCQQKGVCMCVCGYRDETNNQPRSFSKSTTHRNSLGVCVWLCLLISTSHLFRLAPSPASSSFGHRLSPSSPSLAPSNGSKGAESSLTPLGSGC